MGGAAGLRRRLTGGGGAQFYGDERPLAGFGAKERIVGLALALALAKPMEVAAQLVVNQRGGVTQPKLEDLI
uniref:Uncharacterized protein n=1 Tax=Oryza punctata TaxID=4537 RepID=A0A0E0K351_ORYPU